MKAFATLATTAGLASLLAFAPPTLADEEPYDDVTAEEASDTAARGRSNPNLSAGEEATTMPTNPNAGLGSDGDDDPYAGGRNDEHDDDHQEEDEELDADGY